MSHAHVQTNPQYCTGCRTCELVCSAHHLGNAVNPHMSKIRIDADRRENRNTPHVCMQCEEQHCLKACPAKPEKAIHIDEKLGIPVVVEELCVGCRQCVKSCPHQGMFFDEKNKKALKCDLCGGNPQCVQDCWMKALSFVTA